jgi:hypothetical protein
MERPVPKALLTDLVAKCATPIRGKRYSLGLLTTSRQVEQAQARLLMRSLRPTISSGGPRRSITSRSFTCHVSRFLRRGQALSRSAVAAGFAVTAQRLSHWLEAASNDVDAFGRIAMWLAVALE